MNEGKLDVGNVENKSLDSSVPEYAPLSPLRESGSESGKDENISEGEKDSENGKHDVDNAHSADSENEEITDTENDEVKSDSNVSGNEDEGSVDDKESVKGYDSHSGIEENISENENSSEGEKDSENDERDVDNGHSADSENVEITDKENDEVNSDGNVSGNKDKGLVDDKESVKGSDSHSGIEGNMSENKKESESDIVEVSSETVDSKVVGEITRMEPDSDIENHSDTSADESHVEQISYSRTLTDSDKEDAGQHEQKKN